MYLNYKKADIKDIDWLVKTRVNTLRICNNLYINADMFEIEQHTRAYYPDAPPNNKHTAYIKFNGEEFVA